MGLKNSLPLRVLLCLLAVPPSSGAQNLSPRIEQYMDAQVRVNRFSGSVLVAHNGHLLSSKRYGTANVKPRAGHASAPRFPVGSIAMQFTDVAILQLEGNGKLQVQHSVCNYIKQCPDHWQPITVSELMTHTSGIPALPDNDRSPLDLPATSRLVDRIKKEPLRFKPGEKLDSTYSEDEVLHAVIEAVSGEDYSAYFHEHIFAPLQMRHTGYSTSAVTPSAAPLLMPSDLRLSLGYTAARLYSTVEDLYLWDRALKAGKLLPTKSLDEMFTPYRDGYGFGWMTQKQLDRKVYTPGGGIRTYSTTILSYPDDDACVIVLSPLDTADAQKIGKDLAAIMFGANYERPVEPKAIRLDATRLDDYVGQFSVNPDFVLSISKQSDRLMVQGPDQTKIEILPESATEFFVKDSQTRIQFVMLANGHVTELVLQQGGRDIPARRVN